MHHWQDHQHKHHHLQTPGELIQPLFHLLIDLLALQTRKQIAAEVGKLPLALTFQSGGFDGQNALNGLHKKIVQGGAFQLQLLGEPAIADHRPDANDPHHRDTDGRDRRQYGCNPEHDSQRDRADHPVGAQAVVQFNFLQQANLPGRKAAEDLPRRPFFEKTQRVTEQTGKSHAAVDQHKAFDKAFAHHPHPQRHQ